ncbi:MAG: hypothetical protein AUK26_00700 [Syntrophaceae bacterium CG2_30_58_14]|nr:MAG: hypothetical protein AUK26_00700 [Syntrophaceae bacterium CG2_30_58_14]
MILKKRFLTFYERFISLKGEPAQIAAGLAIGVFVGVTPTIPFHTAIIVLIGLLLRQNIAAAYLGSWIISNPLTIPLFYVTQYEIGRLLLGMERSRFAIADYTLSSIAALGWEILLPLLTGGILMAPFFAVPAYFVARRLISSIRARSKR